MVWYLVAIFSALGIGLHLLVAITKNNVLNVATVFVHVAMLCVLFALRADLEQILICLMTSIAGCFVANALINGRDKK